MRIQFRPRPLSVDFLRSFAVSERPLPIWGRHSTTSARPPVVGRSRQFKAMSEHEPLRPVKLWRAAIRIPATIEAA
jgi:hypothetical protein